MDLPLIRTSDIELASTLLCCGYNVDGIDNTNPRKIFFLFKRTEKIEQLVDLYWRGELKVEPKEFASSRREIMARIHESPEEPK